MQVNAAVPDRRRSQQSGAHGFLIQLVYTVVPEFQDIEIAVAHRHVKLAVGVEGRSVELTVFQFMVPQNLTAFGVQTFQFAGMRDLIHPIAYQDGRTREHDQRLPPKFSRFIQYQLTVRVGRRLRADANSGHASYFGSVQIFLAVNGDQFVAAVQQHGGVDSAVGKMIAPQRIPGQRVDGHQIPATGTGIKHSLAAGSRDHRRREGTVLGRRSRGRTPDQFAGQFVEGEESVPRRSLGSPVRGDRMMNH